MKPTLTVTILLLSASIYMQSAPSKPASVLEITSMKDYKELCQQNKPIIIMFYAPWCGACSTMKEPFNEAASHVEDVILAKVNIDNPETKNLKDALCITAVPTFVTRQSGTMPKEALSTMVNGHKPTRITVHESKKSTKK